MNGHDKKIDQQLLPPPLVLRNAKKVTEVERILAPLKLGAYTLQQVMKVFIDEMEKGLAEQPSSLQMENTYVPELPDGTEEGIFLALDLGGTNFRVILVEIKGGEIIREDVKHYEISDQLRVGPGEDLFEFLAECVADFVLSEGLKDVELPLGFTFSFPMVLHSISSGNLTTWTKSFNCPGMEGVDVVKLLQKHLDAKGMNNVQIVVLLNDTTGTLVAGERKDKQAGIGVIIGTGSNGCYFEKAERVKHWETAHERVHDVIIDIEWGAFGDNGCLDFIKTEFDRKVDNTSLLVNSFTFEKYIGGKYLGDLVGTVLNTLYQKDLFSVDIPPKNFDTSHVSQIEQDNEEGTTDATRQILCELSDTEDATEDDALIAQYVCRVLSNRAAQLVSVWLTIELGTHLDLTSLVAGVNNQGIATLVRRMDRDFVSVAVDGSVFKKHPRIRRLMDRYVAMLAPNKKFSFVLAEDGSGKGAALSAAVAVRLQSQS